MYNWLHNVQNRNTSINILNIEKLYMNMSINKCSFVVDLIYFSKKKMYKYESYLNININV